MSLRTEDPELYESVIICHRIALERLDMTITMLRSTIAGADTVAKYGFDISVLRDMLTSLHRERSKLVAFEHRLRTMPVPYRRDS